MGIDEPQLAVRELYYSILKDLKFSINGLDNIEKDINDLFNRLSNHPHFKTRDFSFFSHSFVQLKDLETWETKRLTQFYYKQRAKSSPLYLLSNYLYLLNRELSDFNNSNAWLLSQIFQSDLDVRFCLTESLEGEILESFEGSIGDQFVINIPKSIFAVGSNQVRRLFNKHASEIVASNQLILSQPSPIENQNIFHIGEGKGEALQIAYLRLFELIFSQQEVKSFENRLRGEIRLMEGVNHSFFENDLHLQAFCNSCISIGFLCAYNHCTIEYLLGSSGVYQSPTAKIIRNLGGIVTGYTCSSDRFDNDYKSALKVISNKVSSVLSAQILRDRNLKLSIAQMRSDLRDALEAFNDCNYLKGGEEVKDRLIRLQHGEPIGKSDLSIVEQTISFLKNGSTNGVPNLNVSQWFQGITEKVQAIRESGRENYLSKYEISHVASGYAETIGSTTFYKAAEFIDHPRFNCNIPFVEKLFGFFREGPESNKHGGIWDAKFFIKQTDFSHATIDLHVRHKAPVKYSALIHRINKDKAGGLTSFLKLHYNMILAHGNFEILYDDATPLLNFYQDISRTANRFNAWDRSHGVKIESHTEQINSKREDYYPVTYRLTIYTHPQS